MSPTTATTTGPLVTIVTSGHLPAAERAAYAYVGKGKFEPANAAAVKECDDWNRYAAMITARSAARRSEQ